MSWRQWRWRIAGWRSSDTSGSEVTIAFTASSNLLHATGACGCIGIYQDPTD